MCPCPRARAEQVAPELIVQLAQFVEYEADLCPEYDTDRIILNPRHGVLERVYYALENVLTAAFEGFALPFVSLPVPGRGVREPDIAWWSPANHTTVEEISNLDAPKYTYPNLWCELFWGEVASDRSTSLVKIRDVAIPTCGATCAILAIGLQGDNWDAIRQSKAEYEQRAPAGTVEAERVYGGRPAEPPYVGFWPAGSRYEDAEWYRVEWGRHLTIRLPNGDDEASFVFSLDRILQAYR